MPRWKRAPSRTSGGNERSGESEDAIVEAAARLLIENGYQGFSIEAVAKKARAGKPTIYRWWGSKIRLVGDVYLRSRPVLTPGENRSVTDVKTALEHFHNELWIMWSQPHWADTSRQMLIESQIDNERLRYYRDEYVAARKTAVRKILEDGIARGGLHPNIDIDLTVDMLISYCLFRLMMHDPMSPEDGKNLINILIGGVERAAKIRNRSDTTSALT